MNETNAFLVEIVPAFPSSVRTTAVVSRDLCILRRMMSPLALTDAHIAYDATRGARTNVVRTQLTIPQRFVADKWRTGLSRVSRLLDPFVKSPD